MFVSDTMLTRETFCVVPRSMATHGFASVDVQKLFGPLQYWVSSIPSTVTFRFPKEGFRELAYVVVFRATLESEFDIILYKCIHSNLHAHVGLHIFKPNIAVLVLE